ncbi:NAD(P)H-quinone oxidoreductase [Hoeflea olei]|uniref:NAD(P)H-quinone oxidoreductase n=1 Tax=Hoeflea olei TaxID=1480615 RepID=UPI000AC19160|nr:NAD(P)H-quinone oxidoreductase [Hoeflea olei]
MKHVALRAPGQSGGLDITQGPRPKAEASEVLVRVHAAGVNRPDIIQRLGNYPPPPRASDSLGLEVAGEIAALGKGGEGGSLGGRVCGPVTGGGCADYVAVPVSQLLPVPKGMDSVTAAAIPETYFTVWTNVFQSGALKAGESLLVHGGASGIGTTAITLAHALGSTVCATVSSAEKAQGCRDLGAVEVVDCNTGNFADRLLEMTGGRGVDVILDMRAGPFFADTMRLIATRGRLVHIASLAGREVTLDISQMMRKRAIVTGSTLHALGRGKGPDRPGAA